MKIIVKNQMWKIEQILKGISDVAIKKAVVRSVNRAATSVRAQAARDMKARYNLPISGSSKGGRITTSRNQSGHYD